MDILCIHICKIVFKVPVVHKHIDTQLRTHTPGLHLNQGFGPLVDASGCGHPVWFAPSHSGSTGPGDLG